MNFCIIQHITTNTQGEVAVFSILNSTLEICSVSFHFPAALFQGK